MNMHRDFERIAEAWLTEGPAELPDRVLDAALAEVHLTNQRRRLAGPWRIESMSNPFRMLAAAAVAVVAVGLVGLNLSGRGGVGATPSPSASLLPSLAPIDTSIGYPDLPGWIVFEHFGQAPDGSTTALDYANRMLWLVRADGSGLHELAPGDPVDGKSSPDVSPDGTKVVFASWKPRTLIWEADLAGGPARLLSTDCDGLFQPCGEDQPSYSPDGSKIAYSRTTDGLATSEIAIRDLRTGLVTALSSTNVAGDTGYVAQPSWSPDGTRLVYYRVFQMTSDQRPTDSEIYVVGTDDAGLRKLPRPNVGWAADPDWSSDGSLIVFSTAPEDETSSWLESDGAPPSSIWTIHPDGTGLTQVCSTCLDGGIAPTWTPDGRILFWGYRTFALMNADGSDMAHINQPKLTWYGSKLGYGYFAILAPTP